MHVNLRKVLLAATLIGAAQPAFANVITDWDDKAIVVVTPMASLGSTSPYMAQRMMGMVHVAMFDAVNSIERRYRPYLVQLPADPATSKEAAAAAAAAAVLATIDEKTAGEMKAALATTSRRFPMAQRNRTASSSARQSRKRYWRRGRTTAPMRLMPTGRGPRRAFTSRLRSRSLQCGRT